MSSPTGAYPVPRPYDRDVLPQPGPTDLSIAPTSTGWGVVTLAQTYSTFWRLTGPESSAPGVVDVGLTGWLVNSTPGATWHVAYLGDSLETTSLELEAVAVPLVAIPLAIGPVASPGIVWPVQRGSPTLSDTSWTRPRVMVVSRCTNSYGPSKGGADVLAQRHAVLLAQDADVVYVGARPILGEHVQFLPVRTRDPLPSAGGSVAYLANEGFHVVQGATAAIQGERQYPVDLIVSNSSISTILLKLFGHRPVGTLHSRQPLRRARTGRPGPAWRRSEASS